MDQRLAEYFKDPFLACLHREIKNAGPMRSISVDVTHACNLRCKGCYFYMAEVDRHETPPDDAAFDALVERELARGTNFVSVLGGEPSLVLSRVKKLYDNFNMALATNGIRAFPRDGFEELAIGVSVWGDHDTDTELRGGGKVRAFEQGLRNYRDDPRAIWYFTVHSGNAHEIERVVEQCVQNGNYLVFSYYADLSQLGGPHDHRRGFEEVRAEIDRMIERFPERILHTSYVNQVITTGRMYDEAWGFDVCPNISQEHLSPERLAHGRPYNPHFRAYAPDFKTIRFCCVGDGRRDCAACFNLWCQQGWIQLNLERHLGSKEEFTNWLTSTYVFYLVSHMVDFDVGVSYLPEIHRRTGQRR